MSKLISTGADWTFELIEKYDKEIAKIAKKYNLDTYPNQIEVITAEQMLYAYSSCGMPINYNHWSFGKSYSASEKSYKRGQMGLAYELVINSNPCISYLMEENTMMMQALVIAHACYGHNSFFKGNYLFKMWTDADGIVDYLIFARNYIKECEEKYGAKEVERVLDSAHALSNYGVNRYKRPQKISAKEEKIRQENRAEYERLNYDDVFDTTSNTETSKRIKKIIKNYKEAIKENKFPKEPEENILYFVEKFSPKLKTWQREIIRIVRKMAQYFYPQGQTKVMNEGWACFWHHTILNDLYDQGKVDDGFMLEFLKSHTGVVYQPPYNSDYFSGINPYTLGYAMMQDIKRICENPTEEDREWFPDLAGSDWQKSLDYAMRNFKDESFISQYLSPKVIRDLKLFNLNDGELQWHYRVGAIHDDQGYRKVRELLSNQYNRNNMYPDIQITNVDLEGERMLELEFKMVNEVPLNKDTKTVLGHLSNLWGYPVILRVFDKEACINKVIIGD